MKQWKYAYGLQINKYKFGDKKTSKNYNHVNLLKFSYYSAAEKTLICRYQLYRLALPHRILTPNDAFFHWNPELFALGRQIGAFGVFSAKWSAFILVQRVPCPCFYYSIIISTKRTKPLYPHPKYSFGIVIWIWIWIWATKN